jgi:Myristoyl-CoA:protein N-myristoyltransferase, N-terminal domain
MSFYLLTTSKMTKLHSGFGTQPSSWSGTPNAYLWFASMLVSDSLTYRALKPPGWQKEWHIGVRVSSTKRLVAFISGVPIHLRVRKK